MTIQMPLPLPRARLIGLTQEFAQFRVRRDFAGVEDRLNDDAVLVVAGDRRLMPFAGRFAGKSSIRAALRALDIEFQLSDLTLGDSVVEGERVAIRSCCRWTHRGTGASALLADFALMDFRNERVVEIACFTDTAALARLAGWA